MLSSVIRFFLFLLLFFQSSLLHSLSKKEHELSLCIKRYTLPENESISLYGAEHVHNPKSRFFWGEFGYGAIGGKRSGYLEGGLLSGVSLFSTERARTELVLLSGAGGGGSAPQGGGLFVNPHARFTLTLNSGHRVQFALGYLRFLNGEIESICYSVGYQFSYWDLSL